MPSSFFALAEPSLVCHSSSPHLERCCCDSSWSFLSVVYCEMCQQLLSMMQLVAQGMTEIEETYTTAALLVFRGHHLSLSCRPLTWCAAFVAVVDFLLDFIAKFRVGVLVLRGHVCD